MDFFTAKNFEGFFIEVISYIFTFPKLQLQTIIFYVYEICVSPSIERRCDLTKYWRREIAKWSMEIGELQYPILQSLLGWHPFSFSSILFLSNPYFTLAKSYMILVPKVRNCGKSYVRLSIFQIVYTLICYWRGHKVTGEGCFCVSKEKKNSQ